MTQPGRPLTAYPVADRLIADQNPSGVGADVGGAGDDRHHRR